MTRNTRSTPESDIAESSTVSTGNAGEHLVMAELLYRGFHAFWADRGNPAYDIATFCRGVHALIRVKSSTGGSFVWTRKADGTVFLEMVHTGDFVALVDMADGVRSAAIYVVPTPVVDQTLRECHDFYMRHPRRDGAPRRDSSVLRIHRNGVDRPTSIAWGLARKWESYRQSWGQLR